MSGKNWKYDYNKDNINQEQFIAENIILLVSGLQIHGKNNDITILIDTVDDFLMYAKGKELLAIKDADEDTIKLWGKNVEIIQEYINGNLKIDLDAIDVILEKRNVKL